ncbi:MAG: VOC family protein [Chloroflexi bacterium]|nr:VOC family protein [Chloroflexota bacterium]
MEVLGVDHVGIAVESIDKSVPLYEKTMGVKAGQIFSGGGGAMRGSFVSLGNTRLELVQPISPKSRTSRLVAEKGYGIVHIALRVADLDKAVEELRAAGFQFMDEKPTSSSSSGDRVIFVDGKSLGGVTLELVGK